MKLVRSLQVISGPDKGRTFELTRRETVIGRGEESHIRLGDSEASRQHCKVTVKRDKVMVSDLGSTNGTRLDGRPVDTADLATGDVIAIGRTQLKLMTSEQAEDGYTASGATMIKAPAQSQSSLFGRIAGLGWPSKVMAILLLVVLLSQPLIVWPLISSQREDLEREALRRASVLALALAAANREALRLGEEILVDIKQVAREEGVVEAVVMDRAGRILAPVSRLHQVPQDERSRKAMAADKLLIQEIAPGEYDIAMPIRVFDPQSGNFAKMGTARVIFSFKLLEGRSSGSFMASFVSLLIYLGLAAAAGYLIIRITTRPMAAMRDDCEAAIKGDTQSVPTRTGIGELDRLGETVNRLLVKLAQERQAAARPAAPPPPPPAAAAAGPAPAAAAPGGEDRPGRLDLLARVVGDGILVVDEGNMVQMANPGIAKALGGSRDEYRGKHLLEVIPDKELLARTLALLEEARGKGGGPVSARVSLADGRPVEAAVALELDAAGEPQFLVIGYHGLDAAAPSSPAPAAAAEAAPPQGDEE